MEILQVENLSFSYPKGDKKALCDASFAVERGEFVLVCGESGCGKTTLLKLLKREVAPFGELSGSIMYNGAPADKLDERQSAAKIGFVMQNPDEQIVTDKVWHELAFGLENLGEDAAVIRRRVAEIASYFGIQGLYRRDTDSLSGGQKQLLNLAAVTVMQPDIILLDEPTGRLDPIAAADFIATLKKLNTELGLTVILVEHNLEEVFPLADKVIMLDGGKVSFCGEPRAAAAHTVGHTMEAAMPSAARIWGALGAYDKCPLTVREGRTFLESNYSERRGRRAEKSAAAAKSDSIAISADGIWFRYEKELDDVLREFSVSVKTGEFYSILGGNGVGKTTVLNILSGLSRPYRGRVKIGGKRLGEYKSGGLYRRNLALLPQNPQTVFVKDTLRADFEDILKCMKHSADDIAAKIDGAAKRFGIEDLLERHPYDLSGGEQQKCALVKLLFTEPAVLLLDEPTKGLDAFYKNSLAELLRTLTNGGMTVLAVTHDTEFAARVSDRCGLLFDGEIVSEGEPREFFSDNNFYTTAACRISRGFFKNAVLCGDVVSLCADGAAKGKGENI